MKKSNLVLSAAVAGLFAVSAYAGSKKEMKEVTTATTADQCKATKGATWKDGKCWSSSCGGASGCGGKTTGDTSTTGTTTPATPAK